MQCKVAAITAAMYHVYASPLMDIAFQLQRYYQNAQRVHSPPRTAIYGNCDVQSCTLTEGELVKLIMGTGTCNRGG